MGSFLSTFCKQDTVIGDNSNWITMKMTKASDQRSSVSFLELVEATTIKKSAQHGVHIELLLGVSRNDSIELISVEKRFLRLDHFFRVLF